MLKPRRPRPFPCGALVGTRIARGDPQRGVGMRIGLGEDVEGTPAAGHHLRSLGGGNERPAVGVRVALLPPHLGQLADRLVPVGPRLVVGQAEAAYLVAPRAAARPELEPPLAELVEHRDALGESDRVVHHGVHVEDARAEVDALGDRQRVGAERGGVGEVGVLFEEVVLAHPNVLEVVLVGETDHVQLAPHPVLFVDRAVGVRLTRSMSLYEDTELHRSS